VRVLKIICTGHSGFLIRLDEYNLIFDYFTDEKNIIKPEIFEGKKTCVFVSHNHGDHYNKKIFDWENLGEIVYILEKDCKADNDIIKIAEGEEISVLDGTVNIKTYGSTDEGVSFLVKVGSATIFHAGDLNDWYWEDELSPEELAEWEENYLRIIRKLAGVHIDIAFMPEDPRLGVHARRGIEYFEKIVMPKRIIPMHFPANAGIEY